MRTLSFLVVSLAFAVGGIVTADTPSVVLSPEADRVILTGSDAASGAALSVVGAERSILLDVEPQANGSVHLVSPWPLMQGAEYEVTLGTGPTAITLPVAMPRIALPSAGVTRIAPGTPIVPENLLRFHVFFETPMARGQARDFVHLTHADGTSVPDAFLELGVEIWSADQRRLTLQFDPGRIKRGVGPNLALGAPLEAGQAYALIIEAGMRDAAGTPLPTRFRHEFMVGSPLRSAVTMQDWELQVEDDDLSVDFGREMDAASVARHLALVGPDGSYRRSESGVDPVWDVSGWPAGTPLRLVASPLLEDSAGNTLCAPFDVAAGEATRCSEGVQFEMELTR